jgi:hypothetical protein
MDNLMEHLVDREIERPHPRGRSRNGRGNGRGDTSHHGRVSRERIWPEANVTFERVSDVTERCPRCEALLTRQLGPGVLCSCCGRLWLVREMLARETHWG